MEIIKVENTDVIFNDLAPGKGKIIVSDNDTGFNFSYQWGSIGKETLKEFVASMNSGYFVSKLGPYGHGKLDVRRTFTSLRVLMNETLADEGFQWYVETVFQKNVRTEFNDLRKRTYEDRTLIDELKLFSSNLDFMLIQDRNTRQKLEDIFDTMFSCEIWHAFIYKDREENIFLSKLHKKLKNKIKNERRKIR